MANLTMVRPGETDPETIRVHPGQTNTILPGKMGAVFVVNQAW
jgi:hypothetical protein